ncbi:wall-associated receptor kinase 2-like protein [Cinnamomum micranthum f. kanehirae]|uniref:Wall-associated receptor kinase 2-like protein n=1 Tax=Cinnamomum micranthum f. kanehirae TaxID=337451 RepID=A0A443NAI0_9MAGN|nr:wall-associated receptor kinase 2-like protein [Cinnamomum micranthum f. kanehirae]
MPSAYTRKEPQGKNTRGLHLSFKHHSCHSFMDTLLFSSIILLRMTQFTLVSAAVIPDSAITNCPRKCGNVEISHPFGIGEGCFFEGFEIICNQSIPYLSKSNLQLLEILPGEVRVNSTNFIAKTCFSEDEHNGQAEIQLPEESLYSMSITKNILVGIGCKMSALASSPNMHRTSCASFCPTDERIINGSCNDIDECNEPFESSPCVPDARCWNEVPGFKCECPTGSSGDGRKEGNGCKKKLVPYLQAAIAKTQAQVGYAHSVTPFLSGTILCIGLMLMFSILIYWARKKRELMNLRVEHFKKNGGILLKQQLSSLQGCAAYPTIYSIQELKVATNNYSTNNILGSGGNGTVYKGILKDGSLVAIKKSQVVDQSHIQQFINEIVILTQINHRNVVKLLGCCLEAEVQFMNLYQMGHCTKRFMR